MMSMKSIQYYTKKNIYGFYVGNMFYLASLRDLCIADSIKLPEAECISGIGTAINIPAPSSSFIFASTLDNSRNLEEFKHIKLII